LAELVARASWRIRRGAARHLEPVGMTYAQARVLQVVAAAPEPLRMADLAERLDVVPRSATSMADPLEAARVVRRQPAPIDRRSVRLVLTDVGRDLVERLHATRDAQAEELFARLSAPERRELARLLEVVLDESPAPVAAPAPTTAPVPARGGATR